MTSPCHAHKADPGITFGEGQVERRRRECWGAAGAEGGGVWTPRVRGLKKFTFPCWNDAFWGYFGSKF